MDFSRPQIYGSHSFSFCVFLTFIKSQQCHDLETRTASNKPFFYRKMPIHCRLKETVLEDPGISRQHTTNKRDNERIT